MNEEIKYWQDLDNREKIEALRNAIREFSFITFSSLEDRPDCQCDGKCHLGEDIK